MSEVPTWVGTPDVGITPDTRVDFFRLPESPDEEVMASERCLIVGSFDPSRDFRLSEVPTCVGTSGKPEEICSGVWGYPYVGSSNKSQKFRPKSELPTYFRLDF